MRQDPAQLLKVCISITTQHRSRDCPTRGYYVGFWSLESPLYLIFVSWRRCIRRGEKCEYRVEGGSSQSLSEGSVETSVVRRTVRDPPAHFRELGVILAAVIRELHATDMLDRRRAINTV